MSLHPTDNAGRRIRRVAIVFSGGPAPGANAVITSAAVSFLNNGSEVIGLQNGYSHFLEYNGDVSTLVAGVDYQVLGLDDVIGKRNRRGIIIGTARANPGKAIRRPADLADPEKNRQLLNICRALTDLGVEALISIGGDDTLRTANLIHMVQQQLPAGAPRMDVVHLPKTIDNDYRGIDFTFGYFTAVGVLADEIKALRADSEATGAYFVCETMGRKSGWLAYGAGIAGEANMIVSLEDLSGDLVEDEVIVDQATGAERTVSKLNIDALVDKIVRMIIARDAQNKSYGTIVLAEGLAEALPHRYLKDLPRDPHGHISIGDLDIGKIISKEVMKEYAQRTGRIKKVNGLQLGYESRCSPPHAFDVMLGSQLGVGAYRALVEEELSGHMVSVTGQLDLVYVPFDKLVHPDTLRTDVRHITPGSDFHRLARFLETKDKAE